MHNLRCSDSGPESCPVGNPPNQRFGSDAAADPAGSWKQAGEASACTQPVHTAQWAFERVSIYAKSIVRLLGQEVSTGNCIKGVPRCPNMSQAPLVSGICSNLYPRAAFRAPVQAIMLWCREQHRQPGTEMFMFTVSLAQHSWFFSYIMTLIESMLSGSLQQLQLCPFLRVGNKESIPFLFPGLQFMWNLEAKRKTSCIVQKPRNPAYCQSSHRRPQT